MSGEPRRPAPTLGQAAGRAADWARPPRARGLIRPMLMSGAAGHLLSPVAGRRRATLAPRAPKDNAAAGGRRSGPASAGLGAAHLAGPRANKRARRRPPLFGRRRRPARATTHGRRPPVFGRAPAATPPARPALGPPLGANLPAHAAPGLS